MKKTLSVLLFLLFSKMAVAKDYGIQGTTYEITEKDFLQDIKERLLKAQKEGKLQKFQSDVKNRMVASIKRPKAIDGIAKATLPRDWLFDPSVFRTDDLRDQNGQVFYRAGTKVNPLDYVSLTKILIFIDGDDPAQISWALKLNKERKSKAKIILINGSIIELMREKKVRLYFDQGGKLTSKFGIKAVPATVEQEGKMLRVKEVPL